MSSIKWLSLPEGTQVRMTCDYGGFTKWQIVTRSYAKHDDSDTVYFVDYNADEYEYLPDDQWELIEEPKEEPRLPKQGDAVEVRDISWDEDDWDAEPYSFVCFYKNKVLIEYKDWDFRLYDQWRFPTQEEVTLSDGKTYLVEERDGEKILKLKQ